MQNWENLVKKQLKSDDIYSVLHKPNLEGIDVQPFYTHTAPAFSLLPRAEESTHLVAPYQENLEDDVFAFLLDENVTHLEEKSLFINTVALAEHISPDPSNRYFSLIDVFTEDQTGIDDQLAKNLLSKDFERNICVDVSLHQNAGASIVQQLALALSKTKELCEQYGERILPHIMFRIAVGSNYFFEMAKIRALKILFNQFSKEYALDFVPFIFAETSLRNKSLHDGENNLIRSTLELASAMIAGADAVFSNDYMLTAKSENSTEISFKQQIVLAYESIINVFEDSANGSFYIDQITAQIAEKSWQKFVEIEENGGYLANIQNGNIAAEIYRRAVEEQRWVADGKMTLIGVNLFPEREKTKEMEELYSEIKILPVRWAQMYE